MAMQPKDVAASVRQRLLNLARAEGLNRPGFAGDPNS